MPITSGFPSTFPNYVKEWLAAVETTAGTAPTTNIWRDEIRTCDYNDNLTTETEQGYLNAAVTRFDESLLQKHGTGSVVMPWRGSGLAPLYFYTMLGGGSDAVGALSGGFYPHVGSIQLGSNRCNSLTHWIGRGDPNNYQRFAFGTLSRVALASGPSGAVTMSADVTSRASTNVAKPTIANFVGSTTGLTKTLTLGNQMNVTFWSTSGTPAAYTATITQFNLELTRAVGMVPNPNGKDPIDFVGGEIMVGGSFTFRLEGFGANTIYNDYQNHSPIGSAAHPNTVVWTDADGATTTLNFFPLYMSSAQITDGDQYLTGTASFSATNDLATINKASSPSASSINSITVNAAHNIVLS